MPGNAQRSYYYCERCGITSIDPITSIEMARRHAGLTLSLGHGNLLHLGRILSSAPLCRQIRWSQEKASIGSSPSFCPAWSQLALFSLELVSREQFVPAVRKSRALWNAVIDEPDQERLNIFSRPCVVSALPVRKKNPNALSLVPLPTLSLSPSSRIRPGLWKSAWIASGKMEKSLICWR